jgi:uncharacterized YigZ family protein
MSNQEYLIPVGITNYEQEIKRSRFIARIRHIESVEHAKQWLLDVAQEFPDARHICWAYIEGAPNSPQQACSDAGEPSGTAGKPILNVLQHSDAGEIAAVVVRYFGGIKLGAGGLVRAYSGSTSEAIKITQLVRKIPKQLVSFTFPFAEENTFRYLLDQVGGNIESIQYSNQVSVLCQLSVSDVDGFIQKLPHQIVLQDNEISTKERAVDDRASKQ